jgi:hypothetical protein
LDGAPLWHELRRGRTFHWHEGRLRPRPSSRDGLVVAPASQRAFIALVGGALLALVGAVQIYQLTTRLDAQPRYR